MLKAERELRMSLFAILCRGTDCLSDNCPFVDISARCEDRGNTLEIEILGQCVIDFLSVPETCKRCAQYYNEGLYNDIEFHTVLDFLHKTYIKLR